MAIGLDMQEIKLNKLKLYYFNWFPLILLRVYSDTHWDTCIYTAQQNFSTDFNIMPSFELIYFIWCNQQVLDLKIHVFSCPSDIR